VKIRFQCHRKSSLGVACSARGSADVCGRRSAVSGCLRLLLRRLSARCGRPLEAAHLCQHRQDLCRAARVRPGQKLSIHLLADELHQAGYSVDGASQTPNWNLQGGRAGITCAPVRSPFTRRTAPSSASAQASCINLDNQARRCRVMSWSRC